jgi:chromosome segregation ATPase
MDNNLLFVIAAFIVGVIIGLIIRSATARGRFDELESRARTLQNSAESAKRELTGVQSELKVRDSHINTLNSSLSILEEKTRRAEATAAEAAALVASAQTESRQAGMDIPALKAELGQRDADLSEKNSLLHQYDIDMGGLRDEHQAQSELLARAQSELAELRAQLDAVHAERADLQAGLEAASADKGELESQLNAALEESDRLASAQDELDAAKDEAEAAQPNTGARLTASIAELPENADPQLFEMRDHLVRMTFAGALIAKKLDEKSRELDQLKANADLPVQRNGAALAGAGLMAAGYQAGKAEAPEAADDVSVADEAVAAVAPEPPTPPATPDAPAVDFDYEAELQARLAEIETLKQEKASLMEDLQTTINSKTELAGQLEKSEAELSTIKTRIQTARDRVRELLSRVPADAVIKAREVIAEKAQTGV